MPLDRLTHQVLAWLAAPPGAASRCCLALADALAAWRGHAYHSAAHHAEVAVNAMVLAALGPALPTRDTLLLLTAALAHDLGYDPARPRTPFAAEAASADAALGIARRCGVSPSRRAALRCLILATEPSARLLLTGPASALPPELAGLAVHPALRRLAAILSDADLLSSIGLTPRWHAVQRARLEQELGQPISRTSDLAWLDHVVGPRFLSPGGACFTANLHRIRQAIAHDG